MRWGRAIQNRRSRVTRSAGEAGWMIRSVEGFRWKRREKSTREQTGVVRTRGVEIARDSRRGRVAKRSDGLLQDAIIYC
jgi:hypothetical protein